MTIYDPYAEIFTEKKTRQIGLLMCPANARILQNIGIDSAEPIKNQQLNSPWKNRYDFMVLNPLHPIIIVHFLLTVLYTFSEVLTGRTCLTIRSFVT